MNTTVSEEDCKRIWGKKIAKELYRNYIPKIKEKRNTFIEEKINKVKKQLSDLLISDYVKFIGISGSVAAGFASQDDDIDLFIVVKNNTMWIYRLILQIKNLKLQNLRTKRSNNIKNKLCLNLISEEKNLKFEDDLFTFHELMYLLPIYNEQYIYKIFSSNTWLYDNYKIKKEYYQRIKIQDAKTNILVRIANNITFFLQLVFMILAKHNPDLRRIIDNNKIGRIEFFDKDFRSNILSKFYSKEFKSTN